MVRGLVKPLGNPIRSNYNNSITGVIQRLTIKEHVIARTSAGFWSDQTRTIHEVCNSSPFVLTNGKYSIEVVDALAAELLGEWQHIFFNIVAVLSLIHSLVK